jgi:Lantibiotic dehydratase, N terminus
MTTSTQSQFALAPAVVVRAARWPAATLLTLADRHAQTFGEKDPTDERAYAAALQREVATLWSLTLEDARFCTALAVSNSDLYARVARVPAPQQWNKRARQLAASLYRYLARACWRTEPSGLWAGVALARFGAARAIECRAERWHVGPSLEPFVELFERLVASPDYRDTGVYKADPGASRESAGVWRVRVRDHGCADNRSTGRRRLKVVGVESDAADRAIEALRAAPPSPRSRLAELVAVHVGSLAVGRSLTQQLIEAGLLIGGVSFPSRYETAWDALQQAQMRLATEHREAWSACMRAIETDCAVLENVRPSEGRAAAQVLETTSRIRTRIERLAKGLRLPSPVMPRALLHVDCVLPWSITFGPAERARFMHAVATVDAYQSACDPVTACDAVHAQALIDGSAASLWSAADRSSWEALAGSIQARTGRGALTRTLAARASWLSTGRIETPVRGLHRPPFGLLLLRAGVGRAYVSGAGNEPWLAWSRFGHALSESARPHDHALQRWCESKLDDLQRQAGVRVAVLSLPCVRAPDLMAQPRFGTLRIIDPYGTAADQLPDQGLELRGDATRSWVHLPGYPQSVIVLFPSALDVGARDDAVERLLLTSWRYRPPVHARALSFESDAAPSRSGARMAQCVAPGLDIQRRRWVLDEAIAHELAQATPLQRFMRWQRFARELELPPLLTISRNGEPPLLMPRDSVLVVEVLLRARGAETTRFTFEAPHDECLLADEKGNCHATEIAVAFTRARHAWTSAGTAVDADQSGQRSIRPEAMSAHG